MGQYDTACQIMEKHVKKTRNPKHENRNKFK